jgi:SAM-dependent methyltransferase
VPTQPVNVTGLRRRLSQWRMHAKADRWIASGRVPGGRGYAAAKWASVERALANVGAGPYGYDDAGLDERVVEYPWAFERLAALHTPGARILDAGSVLNHPRLLTHCRRRGYAPLSIVTLRYEGSADVSDDVRYEFADLRTLPYRDDWFSIVVSLSTLEHVGMDNTGYGDSAAASSDARLETIRALRELRRVTAPGGSALVSIPFGARANRGWLRVLDAQDLADFTGSTGWRLERLRVFRAAAEGWRECSAEEARTAGYNDRFRRGRPKVLTAPASVAAAEAVALLELTKP